MQTRIPDNVCGSISDLQIRVPLSSSGACFVAAVSKFKLKRAEEKAKKQFKIWQKQMEARHGKYEETNK